MSRESLVVSHLLSSVVGQLYMIKFHILKKSKKSGARLGIIQTPHGEILTPTLVPVATRAAVKTLSSEEIELTKSQILIANTFHLHLKPGENIIQSAGGLHKFMNWRRPIMTDSGGFQVFSLGFGHDLGVGKLIKYFPEKNKEIAVRENDQPQKVKISEEGVYFQSPIDGQKLFIGPRESIKIQERLGADIIFTFDECTPPLASKSYVEKSLALTHKWAVACIKAKKSEQALFGIIQGAHFKDLRTASAKFINSLGFDGYGIGGELGFSKTMMKNILTWTIPHLEETKPRHLLGIGYPEDMEMIIKQGVDLFDCTVPTHYGRRGIAFTNAGKIDLRKPRFLKDKKPLDQRCGCMACQNYKRNYICHLIRAKEITGMKLLTIHNLYFFNDCVEKIREKIKAGKM